MSTLDKGYLGHFITSRVMCKVIVFFALNTRRSVTHRNLADAIGEDYRGVHMKLKKLEKTGYIKARRSGNALLYTTNLACPILKDVRRLAKASVPKSRGEHDTN